MYEHYKNHFHKFRDLDFRPHQESAIEFIRNSSKPVTIIKAPTGFGKSLTGMCAGLLYSQFTYLVSSKPLQNQLFTDYPEVPMIKGRNNYPCINGGTCDDCTHTKLTPCDNKYNCEYEVAKRRALSSKHRLLNYSYFLTEANHIGKFSYAGNQESNIIICDEGDTLELLLSDFISLIISPFIVKKFKISQPRYKTSESEHGVKIWTDWARNIKTKTDHQLKSIDDQLEDNKDKDEIYRLKKQHRRYSSLFNQLQIFITHVDDTWIMQEYNNTYTFKPTWIPPILSNQFFFQHASKFVLLSATFPPLPVLSKTLGISIGDIDIMEIPGTFPVEHRRVYIPPKTSDLSFKQFDANISKVVKAVSTILKRHPTDRGIIHTVSYKLNNILINEIDTDRFITHDNKNREQTIEYFKTKNAPLVLLSPSIERGIDLPHDLCRFVVWCKAPFLNLKDKLVSKRLYTGGKFGIGSLWYRSVCAQMIEQGAGRGVRAMDDYCETYILDSQIKNMIVKQPDLFSKYFIEAVEFI